MDTDQLQDFSESFLEQACKRWQLTHPKRISEAENLIFACQSPDGQVALRLTHPSHRSAALLEAELDWVSLLAENSISVVSPIPSANGSLVESIEIANKTWHTSATRWIEGQSIQVPGKVVSNTSIHSWGGLTGQIVAQSLKMNETKQRLARHHWNQLLPGQPSITEQLGAQHQELANQIETAKAELEQIPQNPDNYLLAHTDLHSGNVFQKADSSLVALDFDDCCYHYLLQEFAMPIYYSLFMPDSDLPEQARHYFKHFLTGYRKFHDIDINALDALPLFFKLRDLDLKAICYRWNIDPESRWSQRVDHIYNHGNPISSLPWKKWALSI